MPQRRQRRQSRRLDWVYRSNSFDTAGALVDDQGTYADTAQTLATNTSLAAVLYDSHNYVASTVGQTPADGPRVRVLAPARAEGRKTLISRVEGQMFVRPSTWALGSQMKFGVRFGIFEQDPIVGAFLIDPNYSMFTSGALPVAQAANWANDRKWQLERRWWVEFNDNNRILQLRFRFRVNRNLNPNECYGFYMENAPTESVTIGSRFWFRTLVADES